MIIPGENADDPFISLRRAYVRDVIMITIQYMLYRGSLIPPYRINGTIAYKCANAEMDRMFMIGMKRMGYGQGVSNFRSPDVCIKNDI